MNHPSCLVLVAALAGCVPTPRKAATPVTIDTVETHASERWDRAAMRHAEAASDPSTSVRLREVAELELAKSYYALGLRTVGAVIVGDIHRRHAAFAKSFRLAARIAMDFPEITELGTLLAKYPEDLREAELSSMSLAEQSYLRYLLGRHAYDKGHYAEAIVVLERVKGSHRAKAQILTALCHVQLRKSVPAVAALQKARDGGADERLVDLSVLLEARTFFSTAVHVKDKTLVIDKEKMGHAIRLWTLLEQSDAFAAEAHWERAWGHFSMGALEAALSDVRTAVSSYAYVPEAEQLEAHVRWAMGQKQLARQAYRQFGEKYLPVRDALRALTLPKDDAPLFDLLENMAKHEAALPKAGRGALLRTLHHPDLLRRLEYVQLIEKETKRFEEMPARFKSSLAGGQARRELSDLRRIAVHGAAEWVRARLVAEIADLDDLLFASDEALKLSR